MDSCVREVEQCLIGDCRLEMCKVCIDVEGYRIAAGWSRTVNDG